MIILPRFTIFKKTWKTSVSCSQYTLSWECCLFKLINIWICNNVRKKTKFKLIFSDAKRKDHIFSSSFSFTTNIARLPMFFIVSFRSYVAAYFFFDLTTNNHHYYQPVLTTMSKYAKREREGKKRKTKKPPTLVMGGNDNNSESGFFFFLYL